MQQQADVSPHNPQEDDGESNVLSDLSKHPTFSVGSAIVRFLHYSTCTNIFFVVLARKIQNTSDAQTLKFSKRQFHLRAGARSEDTVLVYGGVYVSDLSLDVWFSSVAIMNDPIDAVDGRGVVVVVVITCCCC